MISISSYAIPFRVPGSQRDRQILHYFCVRGAREIASHFNVDFWTRNVLEQSHQESVVRQALVALSSLHLDYTTTAVPGADDTKHGALAQYGRAIQALRRRIERPNRETVKTALTCCILFYCFEATLGDSAAAMRHLDSGLDLLSTHRRRRELDNTDDLDKLSPILESLDLQATIFDDGRIPRLFLSTEVPRGIAAFPCLDEANRAFIRLQNPLLHFLTEQTSYKFCTEDLLPTPVAEQKRLLQQHFDVWLARFEQSNLRGDQDETGNCGRNILLIQWHVSKMLLEANYPPNDLVFGASPNFRAERILDMAHKVLEHSQGGETSLERDAGSQRRVFSSESGIVAPLFALAAKCSDERVCDRALELLTASRRREGLYDAGSMAEVIHQFRTARQQRIMYNHEGIVQDVTHMSLESVFERELNGFVGGMDKLADGLKSEPTTI